MLDFFLQIAGIAVGVGIGANLYGWSQARIAHWMGDPAAMQEGPARFWSWKHIDVVGAITIFLPHVHVGWPRGNILRPNASPSPRLTMLFAVLVPALLLILCALLVAALMKLLIALGPIPSLFLEAVTRTFITLACTSLLPLPPLDGWRLLSVLISGEIRPGNRAFFPIILLFLLALELLVKVNIIDIFFGPLTDALFFFLYLIG